MSQIGTTTIIELGDFNLNRVGRFQIGTTTILEEIRPVATCILGGIFPSGNLQNHTHTHTHTYLIHGGEERTFPDLLLGTFRNEKIVLNTFISVCNIC